mmetsp:Transcript_28992/g.71593  ORF Transcript_28992/g.71593 Transcript_28992/m.71593 type:complete len:328 (+) Transcript_28992:1048-2031(+)
MVQHVLPRHVRLEQQAGAGGGGPQHGPRQGSAQGADPPGHSGDYPGHPRADGVAEEPRGVSRVGAAAGCPPPEPRRGARRAAARLRVGARLQGAELRGVHHQGRHPQEAAQPVLGHARGPRARGVLRRLPRAPQQDGVPDGPQPTRVHPRHPRQRGHPRQLRAAHQGAPPGGESGEAEDHGAHGREDQRCDRPHGEPRAHRRSGQPVQAVRREPGRVPVRGGVRPGAGAHRRVQRQRRQARVQPDRLGLRLPRGPQGVHAVVHRPTQQGFLCVVQDQVETTEKAWLLSVAARVQYRLRDGSCYDPRIVRCAAVGRGSVGRRRGGDSE